MPEYDNVSYPQFANGLAPAPIGSAEDRWYGYITRRGKPTIAPFCHVALNFREGYAFFESGGRFGVVRSDGHVVVKPQFTHCSGSAFCAGLAPVALHGRFGFIDGGGNFAIEPQFSAATPFSEGVASVMQEGSAGEWTLIVRSGRSFFKSPLRDAGRCSEGLIPASVEPLIYLYLDTRGRMAITTVDDLPLKFASSFHEGLAWVEMYDGLKGFIDYGGDFAVKPSFDHAARFSEGLAAVGNSDDQWGYINREGELVIAYRFREPRPFSEGMAVVGVDAVDETGASTLLFGYINSRGDYALAPRFRSAGSFHEGCANVAFDIGEDAAIHDAYIDAAGVLIWPPSLAGKSVYDLAPSAIVVG